MESSISFTFTYNTNLPLPLGHSSLQDSRSFLGVVEVLSSTLSEHLHHNALLFFLINAEDAVVVVIRTEEIKMPLPVLVHAVSGLLDHEMRESCRMPTRQRGKIPWENAYSKSETCGWRA